MTEQNTGNHDENTTPEQVALDRALEALDQAQERLTTAEASRTEKHREVSTKAALVKAKRQAVESGDPAGAEGLSEQTRELGRLQQEEQDQGRVVTALRAKVKEADAEVLLAKLLAEVPEVGLSQDEVARITAEVGQQIKELIVPVLETMRASDAGVERSMGKLKKHGTGTPGLTFMGSMENPTGFIYRGRTNGSTGVSSLKTAHGRAWTNAEADLRQG